MATGGGTLSAGGESSQPAVPGDRGFASAGGGCYTWGMRRSLPAPKRHVLAATLVILGATLFPGAGARGEADLDMARRLNEAFVAVAETVSPSVVVVRVRPKADAELDFDHEQLFEMLPEDRRRQLEEELERRRRSRRAPRPDYFPEQGSGLVLREDGHILTNGHVVQDAEKIEVRLKDGRRFEAQVKGIDAESDLAVIKIDATGIPAARLGDSSKVRVGEFAIAIGAPFYFDYSVTIGHVSGKGRRVLSDMVMIDQDFLQTDASINPGNSGGPLVNIEGEVIGINSMIQGMNTGIGFAVPVNLAREVAEQLIERGRFPRAWLGIGIQSVGESPDPALPDLPVREGVVVTEVLRQGPSWGSDLEAQDVIVTVGGEPVRDVAELKRRVSRKPAGKPLAVEVYRGSRKLELTLVPGELPENRMSALFGARERAARPELGEGFGMKVRVLDADNARRVGLEPGEGVLVTEVEADSPAAVRRIQPGEVITKINRRPVRNPREFSAAVGEADLSRGVSVTVVSDSGKRFEILKQSAE